MRKAIIGDIHGNLEALQAVLEDISAARVDAIYCLGDVVGYGADPGPCLALVAQHCRIILQGNHEYSLLNPSHREWMNAAAAEAIAWTERQLTASEKQTIAQWPLQLAEADEVYAHASPERPEAFIYITDRPAATGVFGAFNQKICYFGHTHIPALFEESQPRTVKSLSFEAFATSESRRYLVNGGSVGQPRDSDIRAKYLLVEEAGREITFKSVAYNVAAAQQKIIRAGLPVILAERLAWGR